MHPEFQTLSDFVDAASSNPAAFVTPTRASSIAHEITDDALLSSNFFIKDMFFYLESKMAIENIHDHCLSHQKMHPTQIIFTICI